MSANVGAKDIVTEGLVLYLDAANYKSYTSGSTVWNDLTANMYSGSLINGPTFSSTNGGSILFDGVDDYVNCGDSSISSSAFNFGTGNFSVSVYVKNSTSIRRTILSKFDYSGLVTPEIGYYMDILATGIVRTGFETDGNNYRITDSTILVNDNKWHNIVLIRSAQNTAQVYIDGLFNTSNTLIAGTVTTTNSVAPLTIGREFDYTTPYPPGVTYYSGSISIVQIYNRALSATEILQNYNATKARFGLT